MSEEKPAKKVADQYDRGYDYTKYWDNRDYEHAAEDPMKPALELIEALLARSPDSVSASKKLLNRSRRGGLRGAFGRERRYQLRMLRSANAKIARKAGMDRTEPAFKPRTFG